jgi:hypothetical protein
VNFVVTAILGFVVIVLAVGAMAVGVMAGRSPIKGSCGGVNGRPCELCSSRCRKATET